MVVLISQRDEVSGAGTEFQTANAELVAAQGKTFFLGVFYFPDEYFGLLADALAGCEVLAVGGEGDTGEGA